MKLTALLFSLLSCIALADEPAAAPRRRNLDTAMIPAADDGSATVVNTFGPGGEAQCTTKANVACGSCSITCPVGKAVVCSAGVPGELDAAKCARPPSCTCK
jgi:hypothetical protein